MATLTNEQIEAKKQQLQQLAEQAKAIEEELKTTTDSDDQFILLKRKKDLDDIRKQINKELGIVIAK